MRRVAFAGATSGMGQALARRLAERSDLICVLGPNIARCEATRADLAARSPIGAAFCASLDLLDPTTFAGALDEAARQMRGLDTVIVSAGLFAPQPALEASPDLCERVLRVDFANTVALCEQARVRLLAGGGGTLCVFSSVAGDRARTPVRIYGAAKAGLSHYLEGLDHAERRNGLITIDVKPGFVRTPMTDGLPAPPFAGEPELVAERVMLAIDRGWPVVYVPPVWRYVMAIIRLLPRVVLRRLAF